MPPATQTRLARLAPALAALGAVLLSFAWALGSPAGSSADEDDHIKYAWATAIGEVGPWGAQEQYVDGRTWTDVVYPAEILEIQDPACYRFQRDESVCGIVDATEREDGTVAGGSGMTRYPVVYYWPIGMVLRIGVAADLSGVQIVTIARMFSALLCLAMVGWAAALLASRFGRHAVVLVLMASSVPVAWNFFAAVNPNGFEIAAAMTLAAAAVAARADVAGGGRLSTDVLIALPVSAFLLSMTRPLSVAWASCILLLVLVPAIARRGSTVASVLTWVRSAPFFRAPWWWRTLSVATMAIGIAWLLWAISVRGGETGEEGQEAWESFPEPIRALIVALYLGPTIQFAFGRMGWVDTDMPLMTFVFWLVLVTWAVSRFAVGREAVSTPARLVLLVGASSTAIMWIQSYATFFAWQGRYYLPVIAACLVATAPLLQGAALSPRGRKATSAAVVLGMAALSVVALVWNSWRYMYGFQPVTSRFDPFPWLPGGPLWNPFPSAAVVYAAGLLGAAVLALGLMWWANSGVTAVTQPYGASIRESEPRRHRRST